MITLRQIQEDFSIKNLIRESSERSIYKARDKEGYNYAIKIIQCPPKQKIKKNIFGQEKKLKEGKIFSILQKIQGIPKLYYFGKDPESNTYLIVTDLFDTDLDKYYLQNKLSIEYICLIGQKLLQILEAIHKKNIVHRDIKPENILLNEDQPQEIFLTDFGLSTILKKKTKKKCKNYFIGNLKFASLNAHLCQLIEKKDDLESVGYLIVYFIYGSLPWENCQCETTKEKIQKIAELKMKFMNEDVCYLPKAIRKFFEYINNLKKDVAINY